MPTLISYARHRYFEKCHGWGPAWVRWLWLDAILFAVARFSTLHSPFFNRWCNKVDRIFIEDYDWNRSLTKDTGRDCWIDSYWNGDSAKDAAISEVDHWEE